MATKTWQINTMERETADGYVKKVIYRVNGADGDTTYRTTGEVDLPKPSTLVPYADLTESQVIGWVKAKLDANAAGTVSRIETTIDNEISKLKSPTTATGKPWS